MIRPEWEIDVEGTIIVFVIVRIVIERSQIKF